MNETGTMNVVLSFIGKMPEYIYECIKQLRLFYAGPVFVIYDDISTPLLEKLGDFNITFVPYDKVTSNHFNEKCANRPFAVVENLKDRKLLFKRSFERFYLLNELIQLHNLKHIWFMELDIMMYTSPNVFLDVLAEVPSAFAYHRTDHCNSGIFYVRDQDSLKPILEAFDNFSNGFLSEMRALYAYSQQKGVDNLTFFPLIFPTNENRLFWKDYNKFHDYIFDGAIMGMFYFGIDPIHTQGVIKTKDANVYDMKGKFMNFWNHGDLIWETNAEGLNIPYFKVKNSDKKLPIANLHIHSKDLKSAVSYPKTNQ
jgi:hypothetical protein